MKKATILFACAMMLGLSANAQGNAQEITYVEDASQGWLLNKFSDNWFITGEGGANVVFSKYASNRDFMDRWEPAAGLYVGKWFSPVWGGRVGATWMKLKSLSDYPGIGVQPDKGLVDGKYYKQYFNEVGPQFDVMLNVTNWVCGYHPGRFYNLIGYVGAGAYWTFVKDYTKEGIADGWTSGHDRILNFRAGIINSFNVSKHVQIALDLRFQALDNHANEIGSAINKTSYNASANLGLTYLFNDVDWHNPVVPVCPEPEDCSPYVARLQQADARIADLERQLKDCLNQPKAAAAMPAKEAPLATVYYPINVYSISRADKTVLNAVASVMKNTPETKYVLTGWADNYTGNDEINTRLRHNRVNGVEKYLVRLGVPASQLQTTINNGNLCDLGEKYVALDRAVTIDIAE